MKEYSVVILFILFLFVAGSRTFSFWKIVINLIQEDDLEVKDTAAGIIPLIDPSLKGLSFLEEKHNSIVFLLICSMFDFHSEFMQNFLSKLALQN